MSPMSTKSLDDYSPSSSFGPKLWFRPKPGDGGAIRRYDIRAVMNPEFDTPFFDAKIHYFRYGGKFYSGACPKHAEEKCPSCDMFFALRSLPQFLGEEKANAARMLILKKISPQTRVYMNVLDRAAERIQVWSMSFNVYEDIKQNFNVYIKDGVDLTDPETGRDMVVSVSKPGIIVKYGNVAVRANASPLGVEDYIAQLHDLPTMALQRQYKSIDMQEHIDGQLGDAAGEYLELYQNVQILEAASKPVEPVLAKVTEISDDEALGEKV